MGQPKKHNQNSIIFFYKRYKYQIAIFLIVTIAVFLRFYNYSNRWGLAYDQAHDALLARAALDQKIIPLLGPFSSAGPFQTGGQWYWIIMLGTILAPTQVTSPWIFMTLLSILFVFLMIIIGKEIGGKQMGLLSGIFAAVSTAQINQSINLTNQTPLAIISLLALWMSIKYLKTKNNHFLFILGFLISTGAAIHLQGVLLIFYFVALVAVGLKISIKMLLPFVLGLLIPIIPIYISDINRNFQNFKNAYYYYTVDQYQISFEVLGRRWLTYLFSFWPKEWGLIIGGNAIIGGILIAAASVLFIILLVKRKVSKEILLVGISLLCMVVMLRYTRTPLFSSYLVFTHPLVFFVSAWTIYKITLKNKSLGFILIIIVTLLSAYKSMYFAVTAENRAWANAIKYKTELYGIHGEGSTFSVYDYNYYHGDKSLPLALALVMDNRLSDQGVKIGIGYPDFLGDYPWPLYLDLERNIVFVELNPFSQDELRKHNLIIVSPEYIYQETQEWFKYHD